MGRTQTKEDKERFFADLELLGESETETESEHEHQIATKAASATNCATSKSYNSTLDTVTVKQSAGSPSRNTLSSASSRKVGHSVASPEKPRVIIDLVTPPCPPVPASMSNHVTPPAPRTGRKRSHAAAPEAPPRKRVRKAKGEIQLVPEAQRIFQDLVFFFVPSDGIGKVRQLRNQRAQEYGARYVPKFDSDVTHVIVEERIEYGELPKAFPNKKIPDGTVVVRTTWFSESIRHKKLRDVAQSRFRLLGQPSMSICTPGPATTSAIARSPVPLAAQTPTKSPDQPYMTPQRPEEATPVVNKEFEAIVIQIKNGEIQMNDDSDDADEDSLSKTLNGSGRVGTAASDSDTMSKLPISKENKGSTCMEPHTGKSDGNPNARTIEMLQEMATHYDLIGDQWRCNAYRKAIGALRKQTKLISTRVQALAIPQIGERLAEKIEELVTTKHLRCLEHVKRDSLSETLKLFMGIYGVGKKQASLWIAQGHRTLDGLVENAELTANQCVGINHYEDFQERIPRDEVKKHAIIVRNACRAVDKGLQVIIGGSYRRGNETSGDIDLVITKPGADMAHIRNLMTRYVVPALFKANFLKTPLAVSKPGAEAGSKWHGASCLPDAAVWRRIDLLYVPGEEIGAAMIYFTGNDIFNRSIRFLASKKGMCLNQHGLYQDVMRGKGRVKVTKGSLLESKDERRIFQILGVPWKEPHERIV